MMWLLIIFFSGVYKVKVRLGCDVGPSFIVADFYLAADNRILCQKRKSEGVLDILKIQINFFNTLQKKAAIMNFYFYSWF